jgi:murein DD-endopeptidase MepM/ murein hydrolase activator NlpD
VRSGPSTKYKVLAVLEEGAEGTVLSSSGAWHKLDTAEGVGWSHAAYLCESGSSSPTPSPQPTAGCSGAYAHPAPGYPVTSEFGSCRDGCSRLHKGIDLGVPIGTSVRAADGGTVHSVGWISGYGNAVILSHCGKSGTLYAHLSKFLVSDGQQISKGTVIAKSGNTGISTGPHLHFEIRLGGPNGSAVNPRNYLAF